ncbi:MAG: recombinase family protein [Syntrophothermus sp.]
MTIFVSYSRVSTDRQGRSGLGLEAQAATIEAHVQSVGGEVVASFVEIESGKVDERPELEKALALCKRKKATLLIAKLDRLSRDAHFLLGLQKSGVPFVAADMPYADSFTVGVLALVAQKEREMISERTKAALKAAKARGIQLGCPDAPRTAAIAREAKQEKAKSRAANIAPIIREIMVKGGDMSLRAVAMVLEARGIKTPRGGSRWQAVQVQRVLAAA